MSEPGVAQYLSVLDGFRHIGGPGRKIYIILVTYAVADWGQMGFVESHIEGLMTYRFHHPLTFGCLFHPLWSFQYVSMSSIASCVDIPTSIS
jgi:hypothetical protein